MLAGRTSFPIPREHESALRKYLEIGGTIGVRSADGAMLARAELFSRCSRPCTTCHGDVATGTVGTGFVWGKSKGSQRRRQTALEHAETLHVALLLPPPEDRDLLGDEQCPDCTGMGWIVDNRRAHARTTGELTARPTGSSRDPWSDRNDQTNEGLLALLGVVSRRLRAVGSPHAEVLCAFCMPLVSQRKEPPAWSRPEQVLHLAELDQTLLRVQGTIRAIWPLTPAGKTLLRASHPDTSPWQAIGELLRAQEALPATRRAQQFRAADEQSERLLGAACAAWLQVTQDATDARAESALAGGAL